jgi:hypothetical protein
MPETRDIIRVTEPIEVVPDEDGFLITIVSGKRAFNFHASRHKVANVNQAVAATLRRMGRDDETKVEPFTHRAAKDRAPGHG